MPDRRDDELLSVVVCCYNEEDHVGETVESIYDEAPSLPVDLDVILVDDGSTDGTRSVLRRLCRERETCRMLVRDVNVGLGASIMGAYEHVPEGAMVTNVPGDNEFVFASIHNFLEIRHEYEMILGYPANPQVREPGRRAASWAFHRVASLLFGLDYAYLNGMDLYHIEAVRGIDVVAQGHAFAPELFAKALLRAPNLRVGEAPFRLRESRGGRSSAFRPSAIAEAVWETLRAYRSVSADRRERGGD